MALTQVLLAIDLNFSLWYKLYRRSAELNQTQNRENCCKLKKQIPVRELKNVAYPDIRCKASLSGTLSLKVRLEFIIRRIIMIERESMGQQNYRPLRHSGLGIASFIMSLVIALTVFILIVVAGILETTTPGGMDEDSPAAMIVGLFVIGGLIGNLAGMALGITGMVQKNRKRIFSILGLILNGVVFFGILLLIIIGLAMG